MLPCIKNKLDLRFEMDFSHQRVNAFSVERNEAFPCLEQQNIVKQIVMLRFPFNSVAPLTNRLFSVGPVPDEINKINQSMDWGGKLNLACRIKRNQDDGFLRLSVGENSSSPSLQWTTREILSSEEICSPVNGEVNVLDQSHCPH